MRKNLCSRQKHVDGMRAVPGDRGSIIYIHMIQVSINISAHTQTITSSIFVRTSMVDAVVDLVDDFVVRLAVAAQ